MTTREEIVTNALPDNGLYNGVGYPGPSNKFDIWLGRPNEYSCDDGVTYWFAAMGLPLPLMQSYMEGKQTGSAYVPSFLAYARAHGAEIALKDAKPADVIIFVDSSGKAYHIELVTSNDGTVLYSLGADSGPSNVDHFTGEGGVHRHWLGTNSGGVVAVDTSKFVKFGADPVPVKTNHGNPPAGLVHPVWWNKPTDGGRIGWRSSDNLPKNATSVENADGDAMALVDNHGWMDVHNIPAGTPDSAVHGFHFDSGKGWVHDA